MGLGSTDGRLRVALHRYQYLVKSVHGQKTTSIALGDHFTDYTRRKVASGEYGSASEVIREALRLHETRSTFRSKLIEAIDQGLASPIDEGCDMRSWIDDNYPES